MLLKAGESESDRSITNAIPLLLRSMYNICMYYKPLIAVATDLNAVNLLKVRYCSGYPWHKVRSQLGLGNWDSSSNPQTRGEPLSGERKPLPTSYLSPVTRVNGQRQPAVLWLQPAVSQSLLTFLLR